MGEEIITELYSQIYPSFNVMFLAFMMYMEYFSKAVHNIQWKCFWIGESFTGEIHQVLHCRAFVLFSTMAF